MKISINKIIAGIMLLISLSANSDPLPTEQVTLAYDEIKWSYLKKEAKKVRKTKEFKNTAPKRITKTEDNAEAVKLIKKFRRLNRKILKTKIGSDKLAQAYVRRYLLIETHADSLANAGGSSEGKGACMKECGDNFPGTGGGNGANRLACKLSCLILGE